MSINIFKYIYYKSTDEVFKKFDNYEIMPCVFINQSDTGNIYESCNIESEDIAIWCVFGHLKTGGLECISDHSTYNEAKKFMKSLPKMAFSPVLPF